MTTIVTSPIVAKLYAKALLDLAQDSKALDKVESDLLSLQKILENSTELSDFFKDPRSDSRELDDVVVSLAKKGKFNDITTNFLRVLVQNARVDIISVIVRSALAEISARRGEKTAFVKVAQDLTAKQVKAIEEQLSKSTGLKVGVDVQVDPNILGGMILTLDSQMIDNSVVRKLERLKIKMGSGSNENKVQTLSEVV